MSDRCLNLRDWEASAMAAGASVLVRPVALPLIPAGVPVTMLTTVSGDVYAEWRASDYVRRRFPPVNPGDTAILREAWRVLPYSDYGGLLIQYRADGYATNTVAEWRKKTRMLTVGEELLVSHPERHGWRTPQTMPAALARHRRPVVSVEAVELQAVSEETWIAAGFGPEFTGTPLDGLQLWLSTYGPGSWSGWCWVVRLGEVEP